MSNLEADGLQQQEEIQFTRCQTFCSDSMENCCLVLQVSIQLHHSDGQEWSEFAVNSIVAYSNGYLQQDNAKKNSNHLNQVSTFDMWWNMKFVLWM